MMRIGCLAVFLMAAITPANSLEKGSVYKWRTLFLDSENQVERFGNASLHAENPFTSEDGKSLVSVMSLFCMANEMSVVVVFRELLEPGKSEVPVVFARDYVTQGEVELQIDDAKPLIQQWDNKSSNTGIGLPFSEKTIPFVQRLFGKTSLKVKFKVAGGKTQSQNFDITGVEDAIQIPAKACNWKP